MTPYFTEDGIEIYHADCREVLPSLGVVDAVITDPPYGETSLSWDHRVRGWMSECESLTSCLWCFGSLRMFMEMSAGVELGCWKQAQEIIWEKQNGSGFHADRFKRVHEIAVQFYLGDWAAIYKNPITTADATARTVRRKKRPTHTGHIEQSAYVSHDGGPRLMTSVIFARNCHGYADHPTQKPVAILDPLLRYSVPPGGIVLDPFMGSGSTLVAARELGMRAIGIDIDEKNCGVAAKRLAQGVMPFSQVRRLADAEGESQSL